jgi:hypothetical protein
VHHVGLTHCMLLPVVTLLFLRPRVWPAGCGQPMELHCARMGVHLRSDPPISLPSAVHVLLRHLVWGALHMFGGMIRGSSGTPVQKLGPLSIYVCMQLLLRAWCSLLLCTKNTPSPLWLSAGRSAGMRSCECARGLLFYAVHAMHVDWRLALCLWSHLRARWAHI